MVCHIRTWNLQGKRQQRHVTSFVSWFGWWLKTPATHNSILKDRTFFLGRTNWSPAPRGARAGSPRGAQRGGNATRREGGLKLLANLFPFFARVEETIQSCEVHCHWSIPSWCEPNWTGACRQIHASRRWGHCGRSTGRCELICGRSSMFVNLKTALVRKCFCLFRNDYIDIRSILDVPSISSKLSCWILSRNKSIQIVHLSCKRQVSKTCTFMHVCFDMYLHSKKSFSLAI